MSSDRTEHQSSDELRKARELSLESTRPPSQIPGYKLQKFIGSGAYGEVWSATDLKTGRKVAVKFYTRRSNADVQLLAQEVQKLVVLSNDSYVVGLLDVGWDANPPYYVMDYIETGSLEDRLKNGTGMPTSEAIELFQEVAGVMMNLHAKGILHCDLKPGNVLLDQEGKPRIADFGQSRLSTEKTPALGTLFFMAPEQANMDASPDAGWDVYGLGALLYCMLTGQPPYYSSELAKRIESNEEISARLASYRRNLLSAPAPTQHRRVPGVDRSLAEIIDKCVAADPKKRFTNVQSVLIALRQRELARARRPLMLLGLLGPILLMGVVSLFGWYAFGQALERTKTAVTARAVDSNKYAAQLAARSASEQVEEYFRAVKTLANDERFGDLFVDVLADKRLKELRIKIADPKLNSIDRGDDLEGPRRVEQSEEMAAIRQEFIDHQLRHEIEKVYLTPRLKDLDNEFPTAASWFVSDRFGNQLASVFTDPENITLGNNYSYRTYFTGAKDDLSKSDSAIAYSADEKVLSQRPIIGEPHLSDVFESKQSNTWKVAFSAPVFRYGEVQGIVAVTVDLGDLIEFQNSSSQYVMLVDDRPGLDKCAILEHPLFIQVLDEQVKSNDESPAVLPSELAKATVDLTSNVFPFKDPLGGTEKGKLYRYDRESIMSVTEVKVQNSSLKTDKSDKETGLKVVAVQDYFNVLNDVEELGKELGRMAAIAGLIVLGLVLGMLWFVNRMMRESRERLARAFSPSMDSTGLQSMDTIAALGGPETTAFAPPTNDSSDVTQR